MEVWTEPAARTFTVFVFMSMLAYSAQDLILEPFAGAVHGFTPGQTTQLSGWHHTGVLIGMLAAPGQSILRNVYTINRGYEDLAERLNSLGAHITVLHEL